MATTTAFELPIKLGTDDFMQNRLDIYEFLREHHPVHKGKISVINAWFVARYDDCVTVLKDPRFVRNRGTITGGSRFPFPLPKFIQRIAVSMIVEDDPEHRRLRTLVHKAFTPRSLQKISERVEEITHELIDKAGTGQVDLMQAYSLPIPVTVIREMMGVDATDMDDLRNSISALTDGLSGFTIFKTLVWDMPKATRFIKRMIDYKRANPADDILTGLIQAEEEGDRLSEEELIAMVYLLIIAGYETTVHLINNSVITLLNHPDQLERLRSEPDLMDSAIEELLRFSGPIEGTKPCYPTEDIEIAGVTIGKGETVMPLLGSANRDPRQFDNPNTFNIARTPNRHLGFSQGIHYCLGAPLARLETKAALTTLIERKPNLRLAVPSSELEIQSFPGWVRHKAVPVVLG